MADPPRDGPDVSKQKTFGEIPQHSAGYKEIVKLLILSSARWCGTLIQSNTIQHYLENGGPAPVPDMGLLKSTRVYKSHMHDVNLGTIGLTRFETTESSFYVEVIDSTRDYTLFMKEIFSFESLRQLLKKIKFWYQQLNEGDQYARAIFVDELGAFEIPFEANFASFIIEKFTKDQCDMSAVISAERCFIFGNRVAISSSNLIAIIAANVAKAIPLFSDGLKKDHLKGFARSFSTSSAVDFVAKELNLPLFEVPTGLKYFRDIINTGNCSVCGDGIFGIGSDQTLVQDGIWTVLAFLSVFNLKCKESEEKNLKCKENEEGESEEGVVPIDDVLIKHWVKYGRHYHRQVAVKVSDSATASRLIKRLVRLKSHIFERVSRLVEGLSIVDVFEVEYRDPVRSSISKYRGARFLFDDDTILGFHRSASTIFVSMEHHELDKKKMLKVSYENMKKIGNFANLLPNIAFPGLCFFDAWDNSLVSSLFPDSNESQ